VCSLSLKHLNLLLIYIYAPPSSSINCVVPNNKEGASIYLSTLRLLFSSYIKVLDTKRLGTLVYLLISSTLETSYKRV